MKDYWITLRRTMQLMRSFWFGPDWRKAWGWLGLVIGMLILIACVNIQISFAERAVTTSLQQMKETEFWRNVTRYALTFGVAFLIVGNFGWVKARLHSAWRDFLSREMLRRYHDDAFFHDVNADPRVDNPDQRIGQDINIFCDKVLTIGIAMIDSVFAFVSFIAILYFINANLVWVALGWAAVGTFVMVRYGKRIIGMFSNQEKLEADFRRNMVNASENALSIASYNGAKREMNTALTGLKSLITHWNGVLSVQRNLVLFKTGYDYMIIVVPLVMTAPLFFAHQIDAGAVVQAGTSFGRVLGALSLIVAQFQLFAELGMSVERVGTFSEVLKAYEKKRDHEPSLGEDLISTTDDGTRVAIKNLTVPAPEGNRILVQNLSFEVPAGKRILVVGPSGVGKSTLLRTIAGLIRKGKGDIVRPAKRNTVFLPQRSYMPMGTLREQLTYPQVNPTATDLQLLEVLRRVNLGDLATRYEGGLSAVRKWQNTLSGGELQLLAIARVLLARPRFVILDEATSALDSENEQTVCKLITDSGITAISVTHNEELAAFADFVLELCRDGSWKLHKAGDFVGLARSLA